MIAYYLPKFRSRLINIAIEKALVNAADLGELRWKCFSEPAEIIEAIRTQYQKPGVVFAPKTVHRQINGIDERIACFDLAWLFGDDMPKIFAGVPFGNGVPDFTSLNVRNGRFGGSDKFGWESLEKFADWLAKMFGEGRPKGHVSGRISNSSSDDPIVDFIINNLIVEFLMPILKIGGGYSDFQNETENSNPDLLHANGNVDWNKVRLEVQKILNKHLGGEAEPDDAGRDFLIVLNEFARKLALDKTWTQIKSGKLSPSITEVKQEFILWLNQQGIDIQGISGYKNIPQEDESGYAFLYCLWQECRSMEQGGSKLLHYLWKRGAPIDPVNPPSFLAGTVLYINGFCYPKSGKLKINLGIAGL